MSAQAQQLAFHIQALGLDVTPAQQETLLAYVGLILKWNKVYNLTAIRSSSQAIDLHLADSLTIAPYIQVDRLADIGAGAGLPGLVLAIIKPDLQVSLIDTVEKKCVFMRQVALELGLKNVSVHHERVENWQPNVLFPAVISRAFAELTDFVHWTEHLLAPQGHWLAMKGVYPQNEITKLPQYASLIKTHTLQLPESDVARCLLIIEKQFVKK